MSVPKDARSEAQPQFVITSRELLIYTMGRNSSFSNKLNRLVGDEMVKTAWIVFNNTFEAQEIKISSKKTYEQRINCLATASRNAKLMAPQMEIAMEYIYTRLQELRRQASAYTDDNIPYKLKEELKAFEKAYNTNWEYWSNLIRKTIQLINGVGRSDKKRFSQFKE